jgi:hypothetical protein
MGEVKEQLALVSSDLHPSGTSNFRGQMASDLANHRRQGFGVQEASPGQE